MVEFIELQRENKHHFLALSMSSLLLDHQCQQPLYFFIQLLINSCKLRILFEEPNMEFTVTHINKCYFSFIVNFIQPSKFNPTFVDDIWVFVIFKEFNLWYPPLLIDQLLVWRHFILKCFPKLRTNKNKILFHWHSKVC